MAALGLACSLLVAVPAVADPTPTPASQTPIVSETPEVTEAKAEAKRRNKRVEIISYRTETSTTYANPNGKSLYAEFYSTPIRVRKGEEWQPIDLTLVEEDGVIRPKASRGDLRLSDGGDTSLLKVKGERGQASVSAPSKLPKPALKGNTATYPDAYGPNTDLVVSATPEGFRQEIVIRKRPRERAGVTLRVPVKPVNGMSYVPGKGGKAATLSGKGVRPVTIDTVPMIDAKAAKSPDQGRTSTAAVTVKQTGTDTTLTLTPHAAFLANPTTSYPVTVVAAGDPWTGTGIAGDTFVSSINWPNGLANSTMERLVAGMSNSGTQGWRSFVRFNVGGSLRGATVHNADLRLWNFRSNTCTSQIEPGIIVQAIATDWDIATLTKSNQPQVTTEGRVGNKGAYSDDCSRGEGELYYSIETMVQNWMDGVPDYGVRLSSVLETESTNWRYYRSYEYGNYDSTTQPRGPVVFIEYTPPVETDTVYWGLPEGPITEELLERYKGNLTDLGAPPPVVNRAQAMAEARAADGYTETGPDDMVVPPDLSEEQITADLDPNRLPFQIPEDEQTATPTPDPTPTPTPTDPPNEQTISLPVQTDTWVDDQGTVGPDWPTLWAGSYGDGQFRTIERTYLKFDTSPLAGKNIVDAKLELWNTQAYGCGDSASGIEAQRVTAPWTPETLTWTNQPSAAISDGAVAKDPGGCSGESPNGGVTWTWPVTGMVRDWASGQSDHGLLLRGVDESASAPQYDRGYHSSESGETEAHPPVLKVTYTDGTSATPTPTPTTTPTSGSDTIPPTVVEVSPVNETPDVPPNAPVTVTFSEPVTNAQLSLLDVIRGQNTPGTGTMNATNTVLTFTPSEPLNGFYTAEISGAKDAAGNTMTSYLWMFSTGNGLAEQAKSSAASAKPDTRPTVGRLWTRPFTTKDGMTLTSTTTPHLMVKVSNPLHRRSAVHVEVAHDPRASSQGKGLIWSGTVTNVSSGSTGSVQVPVGKLAQGWQVRWRAQVTVGDTSGSWSPWHGFTVTQGRSRENEAALSGAPKPEAQAASGVEFKYDRIKNPQECRNNPSSKYVAPENGQPARNEKGYTRNHFSWCMTVKPAVVHEVVDRRGRRTVTDVMGFDVVMIGRTFQGSRTAEFDVYVEDVLFPMGNRYQSRSFILSMTGSGDPSPKACQSVEGGGYQRSYTGNRYYWQGKNVSFKFESLDTGYSPGPNNVEIIGHCVTQLQLQEVLSPVGKNSNVPKQVIRCDSADYIRWYATGCIFAHVVPSLKLQQSRFPNAYNHISKAFLTPDQTIPNATSIARLWPSHIPRTTPKKILGFTKKDAIHRLWRDEPRIDRNRWRSEQACAYTYNPNWGGGTSFPWDTSKQECDEFPFASTYEGSWVWWQRNPPQGDPFTYSAGANYTVSLIPKTENRQWGSTKLGGLGHFYMNDRILDEDDFFIRLYNSNEQRVNPDSQ
ncbi:DNRLRE domain-containing protein [Streptosporangium sp. NPDC006007]|uniref:DNRLRE domain-containing protein n=1 Tax=Streptosporangium sp. NPDC006007 TaxID=3154575 RepID=UPI0033B626AF